MTERRREYSQPVRNALWATSMGRCAFPGCNRLLVAHDRGRWITTGQIAHIHALSPEGPRFAAGLTIEELNSFDNLLLLCTEHHLVVDGARSPYSAEEVRAFKRAHTDRVQSFAGITNELILSSPPLAAHYIRLDDARSVLGQLRSGKHSVVVGLSGSGKTQLAVDLFGELSEDSTFRWWLRGSSQEVLQGDLAVLGLQVGLRRADREDLGGFTQRVLSRLAMIPGWLIVIDDAPDSQSASHLLSLTSGRILVTSTNAGWFGRENVVRVTPLALEQSKSLLRIGYPSKADEGVLDEIARISYGHPLAVVQASSFGAASGASAESFLQMARSRHAELLASGHDPTHASLAASVGASFNLLSSEAKAMARMLANLAPDPIELPSADPELESLLPQHPLRDPLTREMAITALRRTSFIERAGTTVAMHGLVREIVASNSSAEDNARALIDAVQTVMVLLPDRSDSPSRWPQMEMLYPHIDELINAARSSEAIPIDALSVLYVRLAGYQHSRGRLDLAESLLEEIRDAVMDKTDDASRGTLGSVLNNLANVHAEEGNREQAYLEYLESISIKEEVYGPQNHLTGVAYAALAEFLLSGSRDDVELRERSKELHLKALAAYRADGSSEWIADALIDLAHMAQVEGDDEAAGAFVSEAEQISAVDPDLWEERAKALLARSALLEGSDDLVGSAKAARQAVNVADAAAPYSMVLGHALDTHGRLLTHLGNVRSGRVQLRRAVSTIRKVEPESPDLYRALGNLGHNLTLDIQTRPEGIELLEESERVMVERFPRGHRSIQIAQSMLLSVYLAPFSPFEPAVALVERMIEQESDPHRVVRLRRLLSSLVGDDQSSAPVTVDEVDG